MIGLMRVKNEARWIARCVSSILPLCDQVLVMDDHSTDGTPDICAALDGVRVLTSPFPAGDLNETRDKNWLLDQARPLDPDWILMIDGDEMFAPEAVEVIAEAARQPAQAYAFQVLYLWDREDQVRMDGIYSHFWRPSMFRFGEFRFQSTNANGGFHCGNAPIGLQRVAQRLHGAPLLHFGYMHQADRLRKFDWYSRIDGQNPLEDGYRHMVIGDLFPADSYFRWGGPLKLEPLEALCAVTAR